MNGGSDKKRGFNFDCLVCYKKDFSLDLFVTKAVLKEMRLFEWGQL
ncbi:hypothetical protein OUK_0254 [Helicobacter pylori R037c]|nr:hypothetical protein OUK_0254 [Helicobacter pylori R037c]